MNWQRIWTGMLVATLTMVIVHMIMVIVGSLGSEGFPGLRWILNDAMRMLPSSLIDSFIVTWLYVLARPRLGPGPKTAVIMGTLAYVLASLPFWGPYLVTKYLPLNYVILISGWFQFVSATYLAGWQYIEKAP